MEVFLLVVEYQVGKFKKTIIQAILPKFTFVSKLKFRLTCAV